jgi:hypothetical protein
MRNDRNPLLKMFADKLQTRSYVSDLGFSHLLPDLYWSGESILELAEVIDNLENFVLKPSRGSGATIICSNALSDDEVSKFRFYRNPWSVVLYNPRNFDALRAQDLCSKWLQLDYSKRVDTFEEWGYSGGRQRILIEEVLLDQRSKLPKDYKVFVFHGNAILIQVDYDRFGNHTRMFFNENWENLDLLCIYPMASIVEARPQEFEEMLRLAEAISKEIDFLRVDFYITNQGLKFGECTIYPGGGIDEFSPLELNRKIAESWRINY